MQSNEFTKVLHVQSLDNKKRNDDDFVARNENVTYSVAVAPICFIINLRLHISLYSYINRTHI